jgi:hypothetical protein
MSEIEEEIYPPTKIVQDLLTRDVIYFYEVYQESIAYTHMVYRVKPDYVIIFIAPEFGRPIRIQYISEVYNQKKECIMYNAFMFESCEWHEGVTLTSKNVLIYKLNPSLDRG